MSLSGGGYEKSVKAGTKSKLAAPKLKYVSHLLQATRAGEAAIGEVFRAIQVRLKEPTWTVVFKSLILTHMMIRDGDKDAVLDYLANSHQFRVSSLTSTGCSPMSEQGPNILAYGQYLTARIKAFSNVKTDWVRSKSDPAGQGRLRKLSVDKGLLRETESVQKLINPLIKCKFLENEVDNEIVLTAFRLLVADLLVLFQVANEGVINVLEHYFEMSKPDAERALLIYQNFVEQTDGVIVYMSLARSLESVTRLEIPNLQHAPTSLGNSLEEYLRDPDFEQNRIQYLAQKSGTGKTTNNASSQQSAPLKSALKKGGEGYAAGPPQLPSQLASSGNADLMDFFGSIERPQEVPAQQQQQQMPQYFAQNNPMQPQLTASTNPYQNPQIMQQPTNPYQSQMQSQVQQPQQQVAQYTGYAAPQQQSQNTGYAAPQQSQNTGYIPQPQLMNQSTGMGFGGYTPQPLDQQFQTSSLQPQATGSNPFRKSMLPTSTGMPAFDSMTPQRTGGNPFSRAAPPSTGTPLFSVGATQQQQFTPQPYQPQPQQQQQPQQMTGQTTGNPFNKGRVVSDPMASGYVGQPIPMQVNMTGNMMPQQTGTSNPFRRSMMPIGGGSTQQQSYGGR